MRIPYRKIKTLFQEHFTKQKPMRGTVSELTEKIKPVLANLNNIKINTSHYFTDEKDRLLFNFEIKESARTNYNDFRLLLDKNGNLTIAKYSTIALVSDTDEILSFIAACQEHLDHMGDVKNKQSKIRNFKSQAILVQIKKLAKEEKFDFYTSSDSVKMKLFVKLDLNHVLELQIPFSKFEKILPELRNVIVSLKEFRANGIKLNFKNSRKLYNDRYSWISHESL